MSWEFCGSKILSLLEERKGQRGSKLLQCSGQKVRWGMKGRMGILCQLLESRGVESYLPWLASALWQLCSTMVAARAWTAAAVGRVYCTLAAVAMWLGIPKGLHSGIPSEVIPRAGVPLTLPQVHYWWGGRGECSKKQNYNLFLMEPHATCFVSRKEASVNCSSYHKFFLLVIFFGLVPKNQQPKFINQTKSKYSVVGEKKNPCFENPFLLFLSVSKNKQTWQSNTSPLSVRGFIFGDQNYGS